MSWLCSFEGETNYESPFKLLAVLPRRKRNTIWDALQSCGFRPAAADFFQSANHSHRSAGGVQGGKEEALFSAYLQSAPQAQMMTSKIAQFLQPV
jgi:hypothetical protein